MSQVAQRVVIINRGRVVAEDDPSQLARRGGDALRVSIRADAPAGRTNSPSPFGFFCRFINGFVIGHNDMSPLANEEPLSHSNAIVLQAIQLSQDAVLSFWDSLIVVAASRSGAETLYTEDRNHGQTLLGVRIVSPFLDA